MTGIGDLQALFTATQKTDANDEVKPARQQRAQTAGAATDRSLVGADRSVLSSTGGTLLAALSQSDVRTEKVAKLQAAIASGTYKVSSSDVAGSVIASLLSGPVSGRS